MPVVAHSKPNDPGKTIRYILDKEGVQYLGGSMAGENAVELSQEIKLSTYLNRDVRRTLYHASISLPPGYYRDAQTWRSIAFEFRNLMGFQGHPFGIGRHTHQKNDHIHIFIGRIGKDGQCVHDSWDHFKAQLALQKIARRYHLPELALSWETIEKAPNIAQIRRAEQQQADYNQGLRDCPSDLVIRHELLSTIKAGVADQPRLPDLIERLQAKGIEVGVNLDRPGISFQFRGLKVRGSQLGRGFSFSGLQKHFHVKYDSDQDDKRIEDLVNRPIHAIAAQPERIVTHEFNLDDEDDELVPCSNQSQEKRSAEWTKMQVLTEPYQFNIEVVHRLYEEKWLAIDKKKRLIFSTCTIDGTQESIIALNEDGSFESPSSAEVAQSSFWLSRSESVDRAVIVDNPLEVISTYLFEQDHPQSAQTLYLAATTPEQLPIELLKAVDTLYVSTSCNPTVQENVQKIAPFRQMIDPDHPNGWVGRWQEQREENESQNQIVQPNRRRELQPERSFDQEL